MENNNNNKELDLESDKIFQEQEDRHYEIAKEFNSKIIFKANLKKIVLGVASIAILVTFANLLFKSKKEQKMKVLEAQTMELDAGSAATNTDKMWRQNLEDKQINLDKLLSDKIDKIKNEITDKAKESDEKKDSEITYLKEKLNFIQAELDDKKQNIDENSLVNITEAENKSTKITRHFVNLNNSKNDKEYEPLKTADNYIPAGTMIEAATLNGLRTSTSIQSMNNPDEIIIQLLDYGILPNNFRNNLKDCMIIADAYGELSSETVKIRTSKLSCIEIATGEAIETDLVGMVVGQDGYAGIKGTIVSIDQKYLANASIFGIMSGLAGIGVKDSNSYNPFTIATGAEKSMSDKQKVGNNLLQGTSSSLDKLSDYYIAHAERIQPVIEIDRGRHITVAVLKGTYIGTSTLKKAESKKRDESIKKAVSEEGNNLMNDMSIR